jgi:hypothetical protein
MTSKQGAELVLERHLPVMRFLGRDIPPHRLHVRLAYGKRTVASLPLKVRILRAGGLHPLRTPFLDFLDDLAERVILGESEQRMNVILDTTDRQRGTIPFLEDSRLVGEQRIAMLLGEQGRWCFVPYTR